MTKNSSASLAEHGLRRQMGDTPKTLAIGSEVVIKIFAESECFAATAKVVYANSNSGMGLAFREVPLKSAALLRQWLQRASAVPNKSDS
jgi:hypothetical protein